MIFKPIVSCKEFCNFVQQFLLKSSPCSHVDTINLISVWLTSLRITLHQSNTGFISYVVQSTVRSLRGYSWPPRM